MTLPLTSPLATLRKAFLAPIDSPGQLVNDVVILAIPSLVWAVVMPNLVTWSGYGDPLPFAEVQRALLQLNKSALIEEAFYRLPFAFFLNATYLVFRFRQFPIALHITLWLSTGLWIVLHQVMPIGENTDPSPVRIFGDVLFGAFLVNLWRTRYWPLGFIAHCSLNTALVFAVWGLSFVF